MTLKSAEPILFQQAVVKHKRKKKPSKPTPTKPIVTGAFTLTQGNRALINTSSIPKNGSIVLNLPGCTRVTLYQAFDSPEAQAVWKANLGLSGVTAKTPLDAKVAGLMVTANAFGKVASMMYFTVGAQFEISNSAITSGSTYTIACKSPGYRVIITSPLTSIDIPNLVFGGSPIAATLVTTVVTVEQDDQPSVTHKPKRRKI